jgi:hypothetical protein
MGQQLLHCKGRLSLSLSLSPPHPSVGIGAWLLSFFVFYRNYYSTENKYINKHRDSGRSLNIQVHMILFIIPATEYNDVE